MLFSKRKDSQIMNLSFAGCGFLGIYHAGVAVCFRKYAPQMLLNKISGASAGAISACCMICNLPLGEMVSDVLSLAIEARAGSLGPFSPSFNVQNLLLEGLIKYLPDDAHIKVSGKLHISLTRVYDGKNVIVSQFNSKEDLLQALLASCFVPVFSGLLPPRFHGIRYMDGGFSDNLPVLDENTVTVSPFCGESDICPRDISSQLFHVNVANTSIELSKQNINRFSRILFPPRPEILGAMCKQGFDDALRFLHRNNLISCTRCLSVQSTFQIQEALDDNSMNYDPECAECKLHQQEAMLANLPDTVMSVFQNAIESSNKGIRNKLFNHQGMKILSLLTLPCTLPVDIVYATFTNYIGASYETHTLQYRVMYNTTTHRRGCKNHLNVTKRIKACRPNLSLGAVCRALVNQARGLLYSQTGSSTPHLPHKTHHVDPTINRRPHSIVSRLGEVERSTTLIGLEEDIPLEDDTFEQVLRITSQHEAVMAFYYLNSKNEVKVTEIYDVTDAEAETLQSPHEKETNECLEFDNDWGDDQINFYDNELEGLSEMSLEECINDKNIFSDTESEVGHPMSPITITDFNEESERPESDRSHYTFSSYPEQNIHKFSY